MLASSPIFNVFRQNLNFYLETWTEFIVFNEQK
jgi:hypothetical protein